MKQLIVLINIIIFSNFSAQFDNINPGEVLSYRVHYGIITAGYAELSTAKTTFRGKPAFYVKGTGQTAGAAKAFFKVNDLYESYINEQQEPMFYVRNVSEGSYTQHLQSTFNNANNTLILVDKKNTNNPPKTIKVPDNIQDMLSSFYYLRSRPWSEFKVGNVIKLNVWVDDELFPFSLRIAGTEVINTKFGKINCFKIIPSVMSGRVFKEKEGVTMWISNDQNRAPILIKAELAVGSIKASLESFEGLKYPLRFVK